MKSTKFTLLSLVTAVLLLGCEQGMHNGPVGPKLKISQLSIYEGCEALSFISGNSGVSDEGIFVLGLYNAKGSLNPSQNRDQEREKELTEVIYQYDDEDVYGFYAELIDDAVGEFILTADKTLFGQAPGQMLNNHFYAYLSSNYLVSYPELGVVPEVGNTSEWHEIEDVLGPCYMMPLAMQLRSKDAPRECAEYGYKEVKFTITQRLASGKEFVATYTLELPSE